MIKKWLLILRDFLHVFIKRNDKTVKDDKTGYPIYLYFLFAPNCVTIFAVLGMFLKSKGFDLNFYFYKTPLLLLPFGVLMFGSLIPLIMLIDKWLKPIPLPDDLPKKKYRWSAVIFILTFLSGFFIMPVVVNFFNDLWLHK